MRGEKLVVVVDDSPSVRETIAYILEMEGYVVRTAANGVEGFELIRQLQPKVVILDAIMPDMDGFEVCRRLRADTQLEQTSIIMLTSMGQSVDQSRAHEAGVNHFLTKPFDDEAVLALLVEVFQ